MVGVGEGGKESSLARASIVDFHGRIVLDEVTFYSRTSKRILKSNSSLSNNVSGLQTTAPNTVESGLKT
jgi:hypothetical protein